MADKKKDASPSTADERMERNEKAANEAATSVKFHLDRDPNDPRKVEPAKTGFSLNEDDPEKDPPKVGE